MRDKTGCNADMPVPIRSTPTNAITQTTHQHLHATPRGPRDVQSVIGFHRQSQADSNVSPSRKGSPSKLTSPRLSCHMPSWMQNPDPGGNSIYTPRMQRSPRSKDGSPSLVQRRNLEDQCAAVFKFDPSAAIDAPQNRNQSPSRKGSVRSPGRSPVKDGQRNPSPSGKPSGAPTPDVVLGPGVAPKALNLRRNVASSRSSQNIRQALAQETFEEELRYRTREAAVLRHKATNGANRWK